MNKAVDIAKRLEKDAHDKVVVLPVQLEFWREALRALPNDFGRCALFTAGSKADTRLRFHDHLIASLAKLEVRFTGEELRQDDQDVFLQLIYMARPLPLGSQIEITGNAMLSTLRWGRSSRDYKRLRSSLMRLRFAHVKVESGQRGFIGNLLAELAWDSTEFGEDGMTSTRWTMAMDPRIINLFGKDAVSFINWEQRLTLTPLGKWLHSFYVTHSDPFPVKITTIHSLCGSRMTLLKHFKAQLKSALGDLETRGFLSGFEVTDGLVSVTRSPQHLAIPAT
jgi:hypothetical protein